MHMFIRLLVIAIAIVPFACETNNGSTESTNGDSSSKPYVVDGSSNIDSSVPGLDGSDAVSDASLFDVYQQADVVQPGEESIDLSLGGFNQDLPEPSVDCMNEGGFIGCITATGLVNDEPFELICDENSSFGDIASSTPK
jgi:hypothetical protein